MFGRLLEVKKQRENGAADAVRRQRRAVEDQGRRLAEAEEESSEFQAFRARREQELFEEIRGEPVKLKDLELMQARVAGLRQQEAEKQQQVESEAQQLDSEEQQLAQRREAHHEAVRGCEKFRDLAAMESEELARERVRQEDAEAEEIAAARWMSR